MVVRVKVALLETENGLAGEKTHISSVQKCRTGEV